MLRQFTISNDAIGPLPPLVGTETGAVICFWGIVRGSEEGHSITALDYEAFEQMARHQCEMIFARIEKKWPIAAIRVIHRVGRVPVGEASLWVEVASAHRGEAFAASQFFVDEMKRLVPIWKKAIPARPPLPLPLG